MTEQRPEYQVPAIIQQRETMAPEIIPLAGAESTARLPRLGKVRAGIKTEQSTGGRKATDYFVLPQELLDDEEFMEVLGKLNDDPKKPRRLPIMFPTNDIRRILKRSYDFWGSGLKCRSWDGLKATRAQEGSMVEMECLNKSCRDFHPKGCRLITRIQFCVPDAIGVGVWQFDTGGVYARNEMPEEIGAIRAAAGKLNGLPLIFSLESRECTPRGQTQKKIVWTPHVRSPYSLNKLRQEAKEAQGWSEDTIIADFDVSRDDLLSPDEDAPDDFAERVINLRQCAGIEDDKAFHALKLEVFADFPSIAWLPIAEIPENYRDDLVSALSEAAANKAAAPAEPVQVAEFKAEEEAAEGKDMTDERDYCRTALKHQNSGDSVEMSRFIEQVIGRLVTIKAMTEEEVGKLAAALRANEPPEDLPEDSAPVAEATAAEEPSAPEEPKATPAQLQKLGILYPQKGITEAQMRDGLRKGYGVGSRKDLTVDQASRLIEALEAMPDAQEPSKGLPEAPAEPEPIPEDEKPKCLHCRQPITKFRQTQTLIRYGYGVCAPCEKREVKPAVKDAPEPVDTSKGPEWPQEEAEPVVEPGEDPFEGDDPGAGSDRDLLLQTAQEIAAEQYPDQLINWQLMSDEQVAAWIAKNSPPTEAELVQRGDLEGEE